MSNFFGGKETEVGTSVVRVMDDNSLPETVKNSISKTIISGRSGSLTDNLIEDLLNGPTTNIEKFYRTAKQGNYVHGLPNTQIIGRNDGISVIQNHLEMIEGEAITIDYADFGPLDPTHAGYKHATENFGYNHTTNELEYWSDIKGVPVYLSNITPVWPVNSAAEMSPGILVPSHTRSRRGFTPDRPGSTTLTDELRAPTRPILDVNSDKKAILELVWRDATGVVQYQDEVVNLSSYSLTGGYFQVKYEVASGATKYWVYLDGSGTYPIIDAIHAIAYSDPGTYFPFAMFRSNRTNKTSEDLHETEEFKSTSKLLDIIGMDFGAIGASIHENPDIGDVEQAVFMMGVPVDSTNQIELRYLFEFFDRLKAQTTSNQVFHLDPTTGVARNQLGIAWTDADYSMTLTYSDITSMIRAGSIGAPGTYGSTNSVETYERLVALRTGSTIGLLPFIQKASLLQLQRQITPNIYEEITVLNPIMKYDIYKDYAEFGAASSGLMLIPIDKELASNYKLLDRETLYYRSMHFVFNSRVTVKIEWYESEFFKIVLIAVAVVLTVLSVGKAYPTIIAAAGVGVLALVIAILQFVLPAILLTQLGKVVIKEFGAEFGFIFALITTALAFGQMGGFNAIPNGMVNSQMLLAATNGLMSGMSEYTKDVMKDYKHEAAEFALMADAKMEELEKAMELLDNSLDLNPFDFIGLQPMTLFGEKPDDYYTRSVHAGNTAAVALKSVESYVELSLKLPDIQETVGDTFYG